MKERSRDRDAPSFGCARRARTAKPRRAALQAAGVVCAVAVLACNGGEPPLPARSPARATGPSGAATSLWGAGAIPGTPDAGRDLATELGVRFRSDVPGTVQGVRFYKSPSNTGTHVGSLWSAAGKRLASAVFTGETGSGWQQVAFTAPVAIQANVDYVVSYSCPGGHYAADANGLARGYDRVPLHVPANGAGGGNGLFAYGAGSFPASTYRATNYWVDVAFTPSVAVQSVTVAPSSATLAPGAAMQLLVTATYADGTVRDVTTAAALSSSAPSAATVSASGLVVAAGAGTATITAVFGGVSGFCSLSVVAAPLAISGAAIPNGQIGVPYSAALVATGGTPPYSWSMRAAPPPGVSIQASSGVLTGTPTVQGTFAFTVSVTDATGITAIAQTSMTVQPYPASQTIWTSAPALGSIDAGRDAALTLGVRFYSDVAGSVSGIRFYKSTANVGTHVGTLWSSTGARLAEATFAGETASGWQTVTFPSPVPIAPNTTYVASYLCPGGHYARDPGAFTGKGLDRPPLHAPAAAPSAPNGVFRYGATATFPDQGWHDSNYWVDVVFTPSQSTPLASVSISPGSVTITAGSEYPLIATEVHADGTVEDVTSRATWTTSDPAIALVRGGQLAGFNAGSATISAMADGLTGYAAVTVQPGAPEPDAGPGGAILVVTHGANPFTHYLAEILQAEGLNEYRTSDIANVTSTSLAAYDVVILGDIPLTAAQAQTFSQWVYGGGNLIAMRPDKLLAPMLGLAVSGGTLSDGYLLVDTSAAPGTGIVASTIQFHGEADLYALAGATRVAALYASSTEPAGAPAVTLRPFGAGRAAAFTYDLARSVVYTRQGNPLWSGQERDDQPPIRSDDLFFGGSSPDWIDWSKAAIPQADEQQRLFANLVGYLDSRRPLPRFWYFPSSRGTPSGYKAVVVMTGDDHGNGGSLGRMDQFIADSLPGCSQADWECVRSTSYSYPDTPFSDEDVAEYQAIGFEFATHVSTGCEDWDSYDDLDYVYSSQLAAWSQDYPSALTPRTSRTHCVVWTDYDTQPRVELAHGIRLDTNYYTWPGSWVNDRPGFMTGSGIPMRFASITGQPIDVYQAATQMTDESDQSYPMTIDALLDNALGDAGFYGAFTANMHADQVESPGADAVVASAQARGVPVIAAAQLLDWLDGRARSRFANVAFSAGVLTFDVVADAGARNLCAMIPVAAGGASLAQVTLNGTPVPIVVETIKGVGYAFVAASNGTFRAVYR